MYTKYNGVKIMNTINSLLKAEYDKKQKESADKIEDIMKMIHDEKNHRNNQQQRRYT